MFFSFTLIRVDSMKNVSSDLLSWKPETNWLTGLGAGNKLHPANEVFAWLHISLRQVFTELNEIIPEFGHEDQEEMEQKNLWAV